MPTRYTEIDWYDTPRYYDIIFDVDTQKEADFLEAARLEYGGGRGRRVLEPACGSGRLVEEMARRGWSVRGTDLNAHMLDFARERLRKAGLKAVLKQEDMTSFVAPGQPFDIAHCLVSTFKYLLTEEAARSHLQCVARSLKPEGIYVLGFHIYDYHKVGAVKERWRGKDGDTRVHCTIESMLPEVDRRRERLRARLVVHENGEVKRSETNWWFRTYNARQAKKLLASVPELELVAVHGFDYDINRQYELDDDVFDAVLILRRKA